MYYRDIYCVGEFLDKLSVRLCGGFVEFNGRSVLVSLELAA